MHINEHGKLKCYFALALQHNDLQESLFLTLDQKSPGSSPGGATQRPESVSTLPAFVVVKRWVSFGVSSSRASGGSHFP